MHRSGKKITNDTIILDIVQDCHLDIQESNIGILFFGELSYKFIGATYC